MKSHFERVHLKVYVLAHSVWLWFSAVLSERKAKLSFFFCFFFPSWLHVLQHFSLETIDQSLLTLPLLIIIFEIVFLWILRFTFNISFRLFFEFCLQVIVSIYLMPVHPLLFRRKEGKKIKKQITQGMDLPAMGLPRLLLGFPIKMQSVICSDD